MDFFDFVAPSVCPYPFFFFVSIDSTHIYFVTSKPIKSYQKKYKKYDINI